MKPSPEQQSWIDRLNRKNREVRTHRIEARTRIEAQIEEEARVLIVEQSQIANEALKAGVSKTRIGRALGTTNWATVNSVLALSGPTEESLTADEASLIRGEGWFFDVHQMRMTFEAWQHRRTHKREQGHVEVALDHQWNDSLGNTGGWMLRPVSWDLIERSGMDAEWVTEQVHRAGVTAGLIGGEIPEEDAPDETSGGIDYNDPRAWGAEDEEEEEIQA